MTVIEWTHPPGYKGETWNPATGCTKVSQGCKNCFAEGVAERFWGERKFTDVRIHPERIGSPLRWRDPRFVFVNSMSDLFHEDIAFSFVACVVDVMLQTPRHRYIVLTKRPQRAKDFYQWCADQGGDVPNNLILGVSAEDQKTFDERVPVILECPAACYAVSYEPALDQVDFCFGSYPRSGPHVEWLIAGGESGPNARPCDVSWIRSAVSQARDSGFPVFVKQLGTRPHHDCSLGEKNWDWSECETLAKVRDRKGADPSEWPEDLRVRQWPSILTKEDS
jgi:protein gp37